METYYVHIYGKPPTDIYSTSFLSVYDQFQGLTYFADTHWLGVF